MFYIKIYKPSVFTVNITKIHNKMYIHNTFVLIGTNVYIKQFVQYTEIIFLNHLHTFLIIRRGKILHFRDLNIEEKGACFTLKGHFLLRKKGTFWVLVPFFKDL